MDINHIFLSLFLIETKKQKNLKNQLFGDTRSKNQDITKRNLKWRLFLKSYRNFQWRNNITWIIIVFIIRRILWQTFYAALTIYNLTARPFFIRRLANRE